MHFYDLDTDVCAPLLQRLIETKAMLNERNKDERQRREAKQQAKEQARLQKQ